MRKPKTNQPMLNPMMHNAPLNGGGGFDCIYDCDCDDDSKVSALILSSPEILSQRRVMAAILALGSNYQAHDYLPQVHQKLRALGNITLSTAFDNPDFTATKAVPKPDYTNQCVYLALADSMTLQQLQKLFKQFEQQCDRTRAAPQDQRQQAKANYVTMDIDILLVQLCDNQPCEGKQWHTMADRFPFKAHECAGLKELTSLLNIKK